MKIKNIKKTSLYGLIGFVSFLIIFFFKAIPFQILNIDVNTIPKTVQSIYLVLINLLVLLIIIILFKDYLKEAWKEFNKNKRVYFKKYFKYWFFIIAGIMVTNTIITLISGKGLSGNEEEVRETLMSSPIYLWISAVIIAPFLEEFVFRLSFKNIFNNKWLFIILSGITFGSFHLIGNVGGLIDLLYLIPYSIPGCIFAYILYDSKNIYTTVFLHMFHNGILTSLEILLLLLGVSIV